MDELIKTFHIETNLIIAQLVNFTIVLLVLYKFAYKPILKALNDRTGKIEKGIKNAEEAQNKLAEIAQKEKEILSEAKKEAQKIIAEAEKVGVKNKEEIIAESKKQSEKILADAEKKIESEKNKMFAEVKAEVADLIVAATGKIINEKLDAGKDKELIEKSIH
jgi:F-type H+-transporting ATPase subunit b